MKKTVLGILFGFVMTGCQTSGIVLHETPLGISETRSAIAGVMGQPRATSENGREMLSKYFDRKNQLIDSKSNPKERYYNHITILGDRRPYDIQVEVVQEIRDSDGNYQDVDHDDVRAEKLAAQIKKALVQSRDNRNLIDDFNPY